MAKPSLAQMADLCQQEADHHEALEAFMAERYPDHPARRDHDRQARVFESAANLLRILGTFESQSRKFVAGLMEEHQRG